ncbi:MAG TPA: ABC transporter permease [Actinomycetales bacterium]|nr:ABC transporter permease [Actinomycetales bacterium]
MNAFGGTGTLVRLAIRRDRVLMPVWIIVFAALAASSAAATVGVYPTVQSRVAAAEAANATPSIVALYGPVFDPTSLGGIALLKMNAFGALLVAILMIVFMVRHTRAEEEQGRLELMSAGVVGRFAPLSAALVVALGSSVLLGAATAAGLIGAGLPTGGSLTFGLMWATAGVTFSAVAAVAAQLTESARAATGLSLVVLGLSYLFRAMGDTAGDGGPAWLSWVSPIGWAQQIRPFGGDRVWVAAVSVVFVLVATASAFALVQRRDIGAGLVRPRPGRAQASPLLDNPLGLAWRLQRATLLAWSAAYLVLGSVFGNLAVNVGNFADSPQARELITRLGGVQGLTDAFLSTEFGMVGVITAAYGIQAALRLRSEEISLRAEPILATAVSRPRWAASHLLVALLGTAWLMVLAGAAAGLSYGAQAGDVAGKLGQLMSAALVQLPAAWVLTGVAMLLFGVAPRWVVGAWVALVAFLVVGEFGSLLGLSQAVMNVSPFTHVPRMPGADFALAPVLWLLAVAAGLIALGIAAFRRRDVPA